MIEIVPGVIGDVRVRVISVDEIAGTAVIRVIDNNGNFLTPNATLPLGVITPVVFAVALWDVLEQVSPDQRTAVVRWVSPDSQTWSESPTGVPARSTLGWHRIATVTPPP